MNDFDSNVSLVFYVFNKYYQQYRRWEDDLIQEGMIGLWKACKSFDVSKGVAFATYAITCIKNQMLMCLRKELRVYERTVSIDSKMNEDKGEGLFVDTLVAPERADYSDLMTAVDALDDKEAIAMIKMLLEGYAQREIAAVLGVSQTAVSRRLQKNYKKIEKILKNT